MNNKEIQILAMKQACAIVGSQKKLAYLLDVAPSTINQWCKGKTIPAKRCVQIEHATNGAVCRTMFRQKDAYMIWPELADPPKTDTTLPT